MTDNQIDNEVEFLRGEIEGLNEQVADLEAHIDTLEGRTEDAVMWAEHVANLGKNDQGKLRSFMDELDTLFSSRGLRLEVKIPESAAAGYGVWVEGDERNRVGSGKND